ncbi:hypothetical protein [Nocardioides sp.]|uniref:hypothetical protein n=1 Tax=Nocardioides sp. TaxID=35761 RepID=UPI0037832A17
MSSTLDDAEAWFLRHGLPYFVPSERAAVRLALRPGRTLPLLVGVLLVAVAAGIGLAWFADEISAGPAVLLAIVLVAALWYALTALRFRPILVWGLSRTFGSARRLLPDISRALPLLLLAITFLFINTEMWQVGSNLTVGTLWLVVLLFAALGVGFLLVRLPEEVDRADDDVDAALVLRACAGTPLEAAARELVEDPDADPGRFGEVTGFDRWNLILVLMVIQLVQVLLLAVGVFGFLVLFGALIMSGPVLDAWQTDPTFNTSRGLVQVSVFLAAFSGLYLTVSTVTDETYRTQFFSGVTRELERAIGMRAVYLALRNS